MPKLIDLSGQLLENDWQQLAADATLQDALATGAEQLLVPLHLWLSNHDELLASGPEIAVWLDSHESAEALAGSLDKLRLIALNFPGFMDGRSYSTAVALRQHYGFSGELRAIGDVLRDQLYYLRRCGFTTFDLQDSVKLEDAVKGLQDFHTSYASTVEEPLPLFRRKTAV